ncbi:MAG: hypothetical protein ACK5MZ_11910, partial [Aestuariibaculum sp.]
QTGYNAISLKIKNNSDNTYIENANISWNPVMQMETMSHSCPKQNPTKVSGTNTVYQGFIIYQMTNTDGSGWSLTVDYTVNNEPFTVSNTITVAQSELKNVSVFKGSDNVRYVVAFIAPSKPIVGINDLNIGVYKMESMMAFPVVENYSLTLDPRMPDMGNHSSPNNTDLTYHAINQNYTGKLSLTMTGYWSLNLKLLNTDSDVLYGSDVTDSNAYSNLYLDLEF